MSTRLTSPADLLRLRKEVLARRDPSKSIVTVCSGTGCQAYGSAKVSRAFLDEIKRQGLEAEVSTKATGCHGFCERGVVVVIFPEEICYLGVRPDDVPEIVSSTLIQRKIIDRLIYKDPFTGETMPEESEVPFYKHQYRLILGNNKFIDPKSIEDYIALGGYSAVAKALFEMSPEAVLEEVKRANVRGRGGGGFPAGAKWETTKNAPEKAKYVIVNCDEGDPGAYMDRSLMEGNPHSVLEGLTMAHTLSALIKGSSMCGRNIHWLRRIYSSP